MKLSISVPDELWDDARRAVDEDSPSAVVRAALARLLQDKSEEPDYARRPEIDAELGAALEHARVRIRDEARAMYQKGYKDGAELAGHLNYSQLEFVVQRGVLDAAKSMAQQSLEIELNRYPVPEGFRQLIEPTDLMPYLGRHADPDGEVDWAPASPQIRGIDQALTDVWTAVNKWQMDTEKVNAQGG